MKSKIFTNYFLVKTDKYNKPVEVCLAMKKRGFGQGMWNGAGGKPEEGETVEEAAICEVHEEFKVEVKEFEKRGEITFVLRQEEKKVVMQIFLVTSWQGTPVETDEMRPEWFKVDEVPYSQMWASDKEWLPITLAGKKIKAKYTFAHEGGEVESRELDET